MKVRSYLYKKKRKILNITLALVLCIMTACMIYNTKKTITFLSEQNKKQVSIYGYATTADALLKADIILKPDEQISASLDSYVKNNDTIVISSNTIAATAENIQPAVIETSTITADPAVAANIETAQSDTTQYAEQVSYKGNVIETSAGVLSYSQMIEVVATAYCPCSICCAPYDGTTTADGSTPQAYHTLATSSAYAFGTNVYIPYFDDQHNHGLFEVEDRGGAIQGNKIDVFFNTHQEALNFGRRTMTIYILN